jgi:hypothetical protein
LTIYGPAAADVLVFPIFFSLTFSLKEINDLTTLFHCGDSLSLMGFKPKKKKKKTIREQRNVETLTDDDDPYIPPSLGA